MYLISIKDASLLCQTKEAALAWWEYLLAQGYTPTIRWIDEETFDSMLDSEGRE